MVSGVVLRRQIATSNSVCSSTLSTLRIFDFGLNLVHLAIERD